MAWPNPNAANTNMSPWNHSTPVPGQMFSTNATGGAGYPDSWESMQQWQQWAQWQQQYAQWHNQYGDKYAAEMAAISTMTATGRPPLPQTNMVVGSPVPPPPDKAPPPPPPHENDLPLFGQQINSVTSNSGSHAPPAVPAPPHASSTNVGSTSSNNTSDSGNIQNWSYGSKSQNETSQTVYNSDALKKLAEEERTFDTQFKKWEQEIETWKRDNINHPDKQTYNEYKEKYEACRKQLLLRREQMKQKKRKLLEKSGSACEQAPTGGAPDAVSRDDNYASYSTTKKQNFSRNQYLNQDELQHPSDKKNIEPQDRFDSYDDMNKEYQQSSVDHTDFLTTKAAGKSIPGLDLVAEEKTQKQPDVIEIVDNNPAAKTELDYSKISMGINSILGDEKIMNMLSMVASRQDLKNDHTHQQHSSSYNNANNLDMQPFNTWDRRNDNNMYDNRQNNSFNRHGSFDRQQIHGQSFMQQQDHASNNNQSALEHNRNINNAPPPVHPNYGRHSGPQGHSNYSGPSDARDQGYNNQDRMPFNNNTNTQNQGRIEFNQDRQYPQQNLMHQNNDQKINQDRGPNNQNLLQQNPERMPYSQNRMPNPADRMPYQDRHPNVTNYNQEKNLPSNNQNQNRLPYNQDRMQLNRDQVPLNQSQENDSFNQPRNFPNQNMGGNNMNEPKAVAPINIQDRNGEQNASNHSDMNTPEDEDPIFTPSIIVDYEHVSIRQEERSFIESVMIKDYKHVSELDLNAKKIYESEFEEKLNLAKTQNSNNFDNNIKDEGIKERGQRSIRSRERVTTADYKNSRDRDYRNSRERDFGESRVRDSRNNVELDFKRSREHDYRDGRGGRDSDLRGSRDAHPRDNRDSSRFYDRRAPRVDERLSRGVESYGDRLRSNVRSDDSNGCRRNDNRDRFSRREVPFSREPGRDRAWEPNRFRLDRRDDNHSNSTDCDSRKRGPAPEQSDDSKRPRRVPQPDAPKSIIMIDDILELPGRQVRPDKILIILRGPPGSGKSYLAKLIKDRENEHGGSARIMSIDDYFMQESEVDEVDPATGKSVKKMVISYEYDAKSEKSYEGFLKKAIKKTITDGYFSFLIYDAVNETIASFSDISVFASHHQFKVYVCTMEAEAGSCWRRNVHGRSRADIEAICARFENAPGSYLALDAATLLQRATIDDVDMEDADHAEHDQHADHDRPDHSSEVASSFTSKWEKMDDAAQLARLDGTSRPLRPSHLTMGDYLQLDEWQPTQAKPGKKTVRWADIEERREQEKMRAIGFVVGQTDWGRMTDPTMGSSALTQTKYIERVGRNK